MTNATQDAPDARQTYWAKELEAAKKRFKGFWDAGDVVVDTYRLQKADGNESNGKDKYNILYSSTETIRPNLYSQSPRTMVVMRNKDTATPMARTAGLLMEGCIEYVKKEEDFDELMNSAVEDLLLPGLGQGWVRYDATFGDKTGDDGKPVLGPDKKPLQVLLDEMVELEYVYWQDWLCGVGRTWKQVPWVAKRLWLTKEKAMKRFGAEIANKLQYMSRDATARDMENPSETAEAWEIWDKDTKKVYWYAEGLPDLLDVKDDPLKLKRFFPCPRPLRAVVNTRTFVPRALYSQYKSQAETLNVLTKRIRLLGEALRVVGLYDGSHIKLADILNPNAGNRMIAVDNWAMFAQNGGILGAVAWVPIDQIIKVLTELLKAREICKAEIYEITGFSDIVRGVSKASETLGAQNIKANWASARVKQMQAEVQRFARDLLALAGEVIAEHCGEETIAIFSGLQIPTGEQVAQDPNAKQKLETFKGACALLKTELLRVSSIDIETDSTLMADDAAEREDRAKFLAAAGAFLQQAVPAMEATPELGPLLGALLMFTVRSFPSARIIEDEFEKVQQAMAAKLQQPQDGDKDGKKAAAQVQTQKLQQDGQLKTQELQQTLAYQQAQLQLETQKEQNRHAEKMAELALKDREVAVKEQELQLERFTALHDAGMKEEEHAAGRAEAEAERTDTMVQAETDAAREDAHANADRELEADRVDREDAHRDADRADGVDARQEAREEAAEAREAEADDGDA
jgi:hypothetical protein